jgi:hypothetical protein
VFYKPSYDISLIFDVFAVDFPKTNFPLRRGVLDTTLCDKVYQLLAHAYGWWFSPDTPASSTTKTGRHDIAEILLKVALKHGTDR